MVDCPLAEAERIAGGGDTSDPVAIAPEDAEDAESPQNPEFGLVALMTPLLLRKPENGIQPRIVASPEVAAPLLHAVRRQFDEWARAEHVYENLKASVRAARGAGVSWGSLARECGVSRGTVQRWFA